MKKRTVITTETREIWVIQRPDESSHDAAVGTQENPQSDNQSLTVPAEQTQAEEAPPLKN